MQISPIKGQGVTILVVDDDALITLNTADQLSELGHLPLEAFSATEALAILQRQPDIAALITNYSMPGMNGVELAAAARAIRPDLPILLATGYAELPDDAPSDLMRLEKPFRQDELSDKIQALLGVPAAEQARLHSQPQCRSSAGGNLCCLSRGFMNGDPRFHGDDVLQKWV